MKGLLHVFAFAGNKLHELVRVSLTIAPKHEDLNMDVRMCLYKRCIYICALCAYMSWTFFWMGTTSRLHFFRHLRSKKKSKMFKSTGVSPLRTCIDGVLGCTAIGSGPGFLLENAGELWSSPRNDGVWWLYNKPSLTL